jgi:hypothetical protein
LTKGGIQVGAKYLFVRILGKTRHLQANTVVHWGTWLACTTVLGAISFILAEAIPIFNYLIALVGSLCFAPLAISLPGLLWLHDPGHYVKGSFVQKIKYLLHIGMVLLGIFFLVGATYGVILLIKEAYASGAVGMWGSSRTQCQPLTNIDSRRHFLLCRQLEFILNFMSSCFNLPGKELLMSRARNSHLR